MQLRSSKKRNTKLLCDVLYLHPMQEALVYACSTMLEATQTIAALTIAVPSQAMRSIAPEFWKLLASEMMFTDRMLDFVDEYFWLEETPWHLCAQVLPTVKPAQALAMARVVEINCTNIAVLRLISHEPVL